MERLTRSEQPHIKFGMFKIRIPFIHYRFEKPEAIQGIISSMTSLGTIGLSTQILGLPYEVAWSMAIINSILYCLHVFMGDPVVPGWITASITLTTAYLLKFNIGIERIQALTALQIDLGIIFILMGITGIAGKLVNRIPNSIKGGILMGVGISTVISEFSPKGRFESYPISITVGILVACFVMFSEKFDALKIKNKFLFRLGQYGVVPAILVSLIIGIFSKEIGIPSFNFENIIYIMDFQKLIDTVSPFGIGFPSVILFIQGLPMAFMIYIIAFGDFITGENLVLSESKNRTDEYIDFNSNRSNVISGIRNIAMAVISPYIAMCGPLAATLTGSVAQRYKVGKEAMQSIFSGMGTLVWVSAIFICFYPIAQIATPLIPLALSVTLLVQGYLCTKLSMELCDTGVERGLIGLMGGVIAAKGGTWGLVVGFILYFVLIDSKKRRENDSNSSEDYVYEISDKKKTI
ncbi:MULTISPECIES: hypothetical protein [unclassified Clostridioides]|uniref:hypothetical protein n=1 Tax=unclassified Clostridioides TaxID=2635829 RepID=UPI001D12E663|nr:hypothetical protein [Clostridioides sp. ZZV14-6150]MCC0658893.1 hypothetical protein [Clostridioides sp. ZZV14-6154]MCC0667744.1 hypothetical protein [Clostridioides sp. ZZV14-6153]MCC0718977.1 hypothetical protein [Clostridioides sp. ZZV14-6105]MCC0721893.1 hypothetical protein [Clostridioides sp. ZZV14-6104]MCC0727558.1 hypothetical protein [Clostridioides sp. ZZV14-6045]MCC0730162.1 hypothetical protein [Clostridioides sp. ZZV14-6048]MCC0734545.1 hypothetical protein [Clostridioides s